MSIAIYKSGTYYKGTITNNRIYVEPTSNFPEISFNLYGVTITEQLLKNLNIPSLGYQKTANGFQIFNKANESYIEENLPVYVEIFGSPKRTKKWVTFKSPTDDSMADAIVMSELVKSQLVSIRHKQMANDLSKKIANGKGITYIFCDYLTLANILKYIPDAKILIDPCPGAFVVGTKAESPVLELKVPSAHIAKIIGKGGCNIKHAAKELGAKYINVTTL